MKKQGNNKSSNSKFFAIFLSAMLFLCTQISAFAHDTTSGIESSRKFSKWKVFEIGSGESFSVHSSGNGMYVICDSSLTSLSNYNTTWKKYVEGAVSAWNDISFNGSKIFNGLLSRPSSDNYSLTSSDIVSEKTLVKICALEDPNKTYWGKALICNDKNFGPTFYPTLYSNQSGGRHLKTVIIVINLSTLGSKTPDNKQYTITHELGHVIGLADLVLNSDFSNPEYKDYLMGYRNYEMKEPQPQDIKGAAVISGMHTNHSFGSYYSKIDKDQHRNVCSLCDGYKTQNHSYSTYNCGLLGKTKELEICKCGNAKTNEPTSFTVPTLSSASNYKVVDGPLTIRTSASTAASSNGTMSNGQTVSISEIKLATNNSNYVMGKIASGTYTGKWIALGTVSGDVYAVNMSKQFIVLDGPLNVRNTASSSSQSYGTITNGSTFYITDAIVSGSFIFGKISSSNPVVVATDSTCNPNDAPSHWVALDYCGSKW